MDVYETRKRMGGTHWVPATDEDLAASFELEAVFSGITKRANGHDKIEKVQLSG